MDGLGDIGRAFATPQFILTSILAIGLIILGIIYLSGGDGYKRMVGGITLMFGTFMFIGGWFQRKLVRSNPAYAAYMGVQDVARLARGVL